MDWSQVTSLTIPEGNVSQIKVNDTILWKMPDQYRYFEVEYLYLNKGDWFNTGMTQKSNTSVICEISPLASNTCPLVADIGFVIFQSGTQLQCRYVNQDNKTLTIEIAKYSTTGEKYYKIYYNVDREFWCEIDGVQGNKVALNENDIISPSTKTIYINTGPNNQYKSSGKYKQVSLYEEDKLVYNVIPCIDIETNTYGFYETISKKFLLEDNGHTMTGGNIVENGYKFK